MADRISVAVLLSGGGTTLQNILDRADAGTLDARVVCVVSSRANVLGLERARNHGIPAHTVPSRHYADFHEHSKAVWETLAKHEFDLIVMAGYMCLLDMPPEMEGRIMNIHPALIPAFCGKGMYGHHVHEAVVRYGAKVSGCTVHFVDNQYDHGPIILQRTCPVYFGDTPETVRDRVFHEECEAFPAAIQLFAEGRLRIEDRRVCVLPEA